jgi:hypothetical protein
MEDQTRIVKRQVKTKDFIALVAALDQSLWGSYPELKLIVGGNNIMG